MTTYSGRSTNTQAILNSNLWTETSLGSGNGTSPLSALSAQQQLSTRLSLAQRRCQADSNHAYSSYFARTVRRVALRGSRAAFHLCPGRRGALRTATTQAVRTDARTRNHLGS